MDGVDKFVSEDEAREILNRRIFQVKDTGLSYRVLNHWTEIGLIEDARKETSSWRKLSIRDVFWIKILIALRSYGLSLDQLHTVRKCICVPDNYLDNAVGACLIHIPMFLSVKSDGAAEIEDWSTLEWYDKTRAYPDGIRINLNRIWLELTGTDASPYYESIKRRWTRERSESNLTDAEKQVVGLLRDPDADEIRIGRNAERNDLKIDVSKVVPGAMQISKALSEIGFGEMLVKVENGRPTFTKLTKRKKLRE